ncbi:MAG TPA: triose-phosphate isomerase [Gemmatimonadaceae bacterium]|nr:triose-phosphate isomerase [Gemmatimonadaceae bacterium]
MQRPVFVANWKMHHGPTDSRAFMRSFLVRYPKRSDRTVIFLPPAVSLLAVVEALRERPDIRVGIQNIFWEDQGAYTGEVSAPMARDAGASVALVGHSERRRLFGEGDEQVARKVAAAVRAGLAPLLCVGETIEERKTGRAMEVVLRQLRSGLSAIEPHQAAGMIVAYEPVWAIGTGENARPQDASEIHAVIRSELRASLGERGGAVPILYGGSVSRANAAELLAADDVDGLLVGGASLDVETWCAIVRT